MNIHLLKYKKFYLSILFISIIALIYCFVISPHQKNNEHSASNLPDNTPNKTSENTGKNQEKEDSAKNSYLGNVFYVDPVHGNMKNDGSKSAPWRTMQEVIEACFNFKNTFSSIEILKDRSLLRCMILRFEKVLRKNGFF